MVGLTHCFKIGLLFNPGNSIDTSGLLIPMYSFQVDINRQIEELHLHTLIEVAFLDMLIDPLYENNEFHVLKVFAFLRDTFPFLNITLEGNIFAFTENHIIPSHTNPPNIENVAYINNTELAIANALLPPLPFEINIGLAFTFEDLNEIFILRNNDPLNYLATILTSI
jgi:hypothetical protein